MPSNNSKYSEEIRERTSKHIVMQQMPELQKIIF